MKKAKEKRVRRRMMSIRNIILIHIILIYIHKDVHIDMKTQKK